MRRIFYVVIGIAGLGLLFLISMEIYSQISIAAEQQAISNDIRSLSKANSVFTLLQLDPDSIPDPSNKDPSLFHSYRVLKTRIIENPDHIIHAMDKAFLEMKECPCFCFKPEFGISIKHSDGEFDVLLALDCGQMRPFGFNGNRGIPISSSLAPVLTSAIQE